MNTVRILNRLMFSGDTCLIRQQPQMIEVWKKCFLSTDIVDKPVDLKPSRKAKNRITSPVNPLTDTCTPAMKSVSNVWKGSSPDLLELEKQWKDPDTKEKHFKRKSHKHSRNNPSDTTLNGEILYGKFPVLIALQAKRRNVYRLCIKGSYCQSFDQGDLEGPVGEIIDLALEQKIPIEAVSNERLGQLVVDPLQGFRQHQGVCADVSPLDYRVLDSHTQELELVTEGPLHPRLWLLAQSVQDPNNFGAILRSAFYLGLDRIITNNSCKLSAAVSKVSAGAVELIDVYSTPDTTTFLKDCHKYGWQILGTTGNMDCSAVVSLPQVTVDKDTILVLGNEGEGLSDEVTELCDKLVMIPRSPIAQPGSRLVDSLNVSVATGIILHDLIQKRDS